MARPTIETQSGRKLELREWPLRKTFEFGRAVAQAVSTLSELKTPQPVEVIAPKLLAIVSAENEDLCTNLLVLGLKLPLSEAIQLVNDGEVGGAALVEVVKHNLNFLQGLLGLTAKSSANSLN